MTRFAREWNGELGAFWQKNAHEEAARLLAQRDNIEVDEDGAAKWKNNGSYLPADVVEKLIFAGADFFSEEATAAKRKAQTTEFLGNYRRSHRTTAEERTEMEAAFGKGTTVVNIITGEKIKL
ncbi:hypothetical protein [Chordicoccus furentiruminis]|uniref:hypothetical protein n=1 Tax=Chordicoccus furentiruminis TaxID=2709410 RepID=UPI0023A82A4A|nr:hypothetical protein [Chordicoccus furentiruminis]